jgi:hypothetical protein
MLASNGDGKNPDGENNNGCNAQFNDGCEHD